MYIHLNNEKIEIKQEATVVQEITPHLSNYILNVFYKIYLENIFERFIKSGEELKKQLSKLIEKGEFSKAEELARGSLKDCQNFIKDFLVGTKYHMQLEKAISDLNSVLSVITTKQEKAKEEERSKSP